MSSMLKDLLHPAVFPERTERVFLIHTHISSVFITDEFVYKLKKPVDFGFLNFTSLEKRKYFCEQEVKLNRRLAEDIYIGVLPVTFDGQNHRIGGNKGEIVEYAVKMRRIPSDCLMSVLLKKGTLTTSHLETIARILARFHARADRSGEIERFGMPDVFKVNTDENFEQTRKYVGITIPHDDFKDLYEWTNAFYQKNLSLFMERIAAKKIRDCHGDLHMEHICFTEKPAIIDCIEFNDRFRYSDTIADIAFLLMDLEVQGGSFHSEHLWSYYARESGDTGMDELLKFYKVYRAYVRGKVISFRLDDVNIMEEEKETAAKEAGEYFRLARFYID